MEWPEEKQGLWGVEEDRMNFQRRKNGVLLRNSWYFVSILMEKI